MLGRRSLAVQFDAERRSPYFIAHFPLISGFVLPDSAIDAFDRALLELVKQNNLTPARALAEQVGLSESAVHRRLRRLRAAGVIVADISIVKPASLGRPLTMFVLVSMVREGRAQIEAFRDRLRERPEVARVWYVTGNVDFVLLLNLSDMAEYEAFTNELFLSDPNIGKFETLMSLRELVSPPHRQADDHAGKLSHDCPRAADV